MITTGGGFSTYFPQPSWQQAAVKSYFAKQQNSAPGYNRYGRGYPDISLIGTYYLTAIQQQLYLLSGTSCSAPLLAAFVTLTNSVRKKAGLPSIGFLNPTLYSSNPSPVFVDVTSGNNNCCVFTGGNYNAATCCSAGFTSQPGL